MVLKQILLQIGGLYCRVMKQDSAKSLQRYRQQDITDRPDHGVEDLVLVLALPLVPELHQVLQDLL